MMIKIRTEEQMIWTKTDIVFCAVSRRDGGHEKCHRSRNLDGISHRPRSRDVIHLTNMPSAEGKSQKRKSNHILLWTELITMGRTSSCGLSASGWLYQSPYSLYRYRIMDDQIKPNQIKIFKVGKLRLKENKLAMYSIISIINSHNNSDISVKYVSTLLWNRTWI